MLVLSQFPYVLPLVGLAFVIAACAGPDDTVDCPEISLSDGFGKIARAGTEQGGLVQIRLDSVNTSCIDAGGGIVRMEARLGLDVSRIDDADRNLGEVAGFDATFVFIDRSDLVIEREIFSDVVTIEPGDARAYEVAQIFLDIPDGARVVFGLGRRGSGR